MAKINRRKFFAATATGIVGLSLGKHINAAPARGMGTPKTSGDATDGPKILKYNPLGKTGIKTSDVIFGTTNIFSPNVIIYAYDLGINVFDTADNYMRGRSEEFVGEALKNVRKKTIIITKHGFRPDQPATKKALIDRMNASLKRMQTDYIDIAFLHGIDDLSLFKNDGIRAAYDQLKKEGKVRFTGFSTHNASVTLKECVKPEYSDFAQVVLFIYNHMEGKPIEPLIAKIHAKGIGTIAMKVLAGGRQGNLKSFVNDKVSYPEAAISWVLANRNVNCAAISMGSFTHVEQYIAASGKALKRDDLALLKKYQKAVDDSYCRVSCSVCESSCPSNVAISDIMRYRMYFEDYGHEKRAIEYYAELDKSKKPLDCTSCSGQCISACRYGLNVKEMLISTHDILTV